MRTPKFICAYCGAEYDDLEGRERCEFECDMKRTQEQREQDERAINEEFQKFVSMSRKFTQKYHMNVNVLVGDAHVLAVR